MLSIELLLGGIWGENWPKFGGDEAVKSMAVSSVNGKERVRWWTGWMAKVLKVFAGVIGGCCCRSCKCGGCWCWLEFWGNESARWWQIIDDDGDDVDITNIAKITNGKNYKNKKRR